MSAKKLERLVNLLLLLLSARRPLTVEEIRRLHSAYDQDDAEAFRRMFERDKEELRELGVPLETAWIDAWESEQGYWVRKGDYELPPLELEPDEAAAVALAARLWQSAGLADASQSALLKLRAAGIEADEVGSVAVEPRVATSDAAFEPVLAAVRARQPLRFDYRAAAGEVATRQVDPWQVLHRRGRWYLVGHDRDRGAPRAFRLDRVVGIPVAAGAAGSAGLAPAGFDSSTAVAGFDEAPADTTAEVVVAAGTCWALRRRASAAVEQADGTTRLTLPIGDLDRAADWVVGFAPDAVVVEPAALRDAVVARLGGVLEPTP